VSVASADVLLVVVVVVVLLVGVEDVVVTVGVCAAMTDVAADVAMVEPFLLLPVTTTRNVVPTSDRVKT